MDFSEEKPLFAQLQDLQGKAPRIALLSKNSENSEYTNHATNNRNCYLSIVVFHSENVLYSRKIMASKDLVDCYFILESSELAYECVWGGNIYACSYLMNCFSVSDSHYCIDCKNCSHCLLCSNLRNKKYCIRNQQYSASEWNAIAKALLNGNVARMRLEKEFAEIRSLHTFYRPTEMTQCEDCTGDYLMNCKNVFQCHSSAFGEDMRYCIEFDTAGTKRTSTCCIDSYAFGPADFLFEVHAQANGYANIVSNFSYDIRNSMLIDNCHNSSHCFGCIGLKNRQYCILNKQYTKSEYEALVPRIIAHMQHAGEWGVFFPIEMSPFAYNETVAQEYFPLTKDDIIHRGWKWSEPEHDMTNVEKVIPASQLPDTIDEIPDNILDWAIACDRTKKPFKITRQELVFYRRMLLPIPRLHPNERYRRRMALRNPRRLWNRSCAKCHELIVTSYAPDRPEIVYCEECYLTAIS